MSLPHVIVVGADKGGVGKTTIARSLVDYYQSRGVTIRAFDTEHPEGVLQRFHPDKTKVVDLEESDHQMEVFDHLRSAHVTLVDIRAGLLSKTLRTLSEIGFLDGVKEGRLRISVIHVIGSNKASFDEIDSTAALLDGARRHILLNHTDDSKFPGLPPSVVAPIMVGPINTLARDTVDRAGVGFDAFIADQGGSQVMRGYIRAWLKRTFDAFDAAGLNAV